jgi:uncharacterized membrane protein
MKKILFALFLSLMLVVPEALAQRTGGRFGGGGGFRPKTTSGSQVNSPNYNSGGGFSGGFFFFPSFGYGYGGGGSILTGLVLLGLLYFFLVRPAMNARRRSFMGGGDEGYSEGPATKPGVYTLDIAVSSTAARDLQKRLEEIGIAADSPEGLARALKETALLLNRRKDEVEGAAVTAKEKISITEAEQLFESAVTRARSRYQVDTFSAEQGKVRRSASPEGTGKDGIMEYLVLSFVVGTTQPLNLPKLEERKNLEELLFKLSSVPAAQLAALEVVWTPGDPNDSLTKDDLMASFPEIVML